MNRDDIIRMAQELWRRHQGGGENQMIDATKLQCLTTANWLKGYASTLDADLHSALIHRLNQASQLLQQVWDEYEKAQGETHDYK